MKFTNLFKKLESIKEKKYFFPFEKLTFSGQEIFYLVNNLCKIYDKKIDKKNIDKVAIIYENSIEYVALSFYLILKKKILVPINPLLTSIETEQIINHSKAKYIFSAQKFSNKIKNYENKSIFTYGKENYDLIQKNKKKFSINFKKKISKKNIILLLYTSGSTGTPKGALLTLGNILSNAESIGEHHKIKKNTNTLVLMPMFHNNGYIISFFSTFLRQGNLIVVPANFVILKFWNLINKYKINYTSLMPSVLAMISRFGGKSKNESLKYIACGGQKLPRLLLKKFEKNHNTKIIEHYGLTETTSVSTIMPLVKRNLESVGRVIKGTKIKMLNPKNFKLKNEGYGEICISGPNLFNGYYNNKKLNKEKKIYNYLRTGDYGFKDKKNNLFFKGRKDFLIIKNGENIYPAEIESKIYEIDEVLECAVVGLPHKIFGEQIYGFVKLKKINSKKINEIHLHLIKSLAKFKIPEKIFFLGKNINLKELPKTATKKIKYNDLKIILRNEKKKYKNNRS